MSHDPPPSPFPNVSVLLYSLVFSQCIDPPTLKFVAPLLFVRDCFAMYCVVMIKLMTLNEQQPPALTQREGSTATARETQQISSLLGERQESRLVINRTDKVRLNIKDSRVISRNFEISNLH